MSEELTAEIYRILSQRFRYRPAAIRNMLDAPDRLSGTQRDDYRLAKSQALTNVEAR